MGVDAFDYSFFTIVPKVKGCSIDQSLKPLVRSVLVVDLLALSEFESCLYMLIEQLVDPGLVAVLLSGLLQHCLIHSDENSDELMC